ncbi:MAG: DUF2236 domain-containing protein [Deltaproteobacteria bacterium]|nr:MAG: DUF2236 domain-containing protein [Deltaproteobacteria bacterium]
MGSKIFGLNANFYMGLTPLYLQMAHYGVGEAVARGTFIDHPFTRSLMTYLGTSLILFGDKATSIRAALFVYQKHAQVYGTLDHPILTPEGEITHYKALDPAALLWVFATFVMSALSNYEFFYGPMSAKEKESFYRETRPLALLSAIPPDILPLSFAAFETYYHSMIESPYITITPRSRKAMEDITSKISGHLSPYLKAMSAVRLPPKIRDGFGMRVDRATENLSKKAETFFRAHEKLPARLRRSPLESFVREQVGTSDWSDTALTHSLRIIEALGLELEANSNRRISLSPLTIGLRTLERYRRV